MSIWIVNDNSLKEYWFYSIYSFGKEAHGYFNELSDYKNIVKRIKEHLYEKHKKDAEIMNYFKEHPINTLKDLNTFYEKFDTFDSDVEEIQLLLEVGFNKLVHTTYDENEDCIIAYIFTKSHPIPETIFQKEGD